MIIHSSVFNIKLHLLQEIPVFPILKSHNPKKQTSKGASLPELLYFGVLIALKLPKPAYKKFYMINNYSHNIVNYIYGMVHCGFVKFQPVLSGGLLAHTAAVGAQYRAFFSCHKACMLHAKTHQFQFCLKCTANFTLSPKIHV